MHTLATSRFKKRLLLKTKIPLGSFCTELLLSCLNFNMIPFQQFPHHQPTPQPGWMRHTWTQDTKKYLCGTTSFMKIDFNLTTVTWVSSPRSQLEENLTLQGGCSKSPLLALSSSPHKKVLKGKELCGKGSEVIFYDRTQPAHPDLAVIFKHSLVLFITKDSAMKLLLRLLA